MRTMKTAPPGVAFLQKMFCYAVLVLAAMLVAVPALAQAILPIDYPARVVVGAFNIMEQPAELGAQQVNLQEVGLVPRTMAELNCELCQSGDETADGDICATNRLDTGQGILQEVSPMASTSFVVVLPSRQLVANQAVAHHLIE